MSKRGIDRRTFIVVGSAAVAGLATNRLNAQSAPALVVSVGYRATSTKGGKNGLVDAASVMTTEPSFIRTGARVAIRGNARQSAVAVDVHHGADLVEGKVVFHAWASESNALSFNVPVEMTQTLDIAVTVEKARHVFAFTVANAQGAMRLNPGVYVFAVSERPPSWPSLRLENNVLKKSDGSAVAFDYVVVSVSSPA